MTAEQQIKKDAKKAFKQEQKNIKENKISWLENQINTNSKAIITGVLDSEHELEKDHPIFIDYKYVITCDQYPMGRVITSDIEGNTIRFIRDLEQYWKYSNITVYTCDLFNRNLNIF